MTPHLPYVAQSPDQLRLRLYWGGVDLAPFTVLQTAQAIAGGCRVTAHILGASHAVSFKVGKHSFTEVFACHDNPPPERPLPAHWAGAYRFTTKSMELAPGRMENPDALIRLFQAFPAAGGMSAPAETVVMVRYDGGMLVVHSEHTYPEHSRTVMSRSCFNPNHPYERRAS